MKTDDSRTHVFKYDEREFTMYSHFCEFCGLGTNWPNDITSRNIRCITFMGIRLTKAKREYYATEIK